MINGNSDRLYFLGLQNYCRHWLQPWNWKTLATWKKSYDRPRQYIKKKRHHFADKDLSSQIYGFARNHVRMWKSDHNEDWVLKNRSFLIMVLEKTLKSPLNSRDARTSNQSILKEINPEYSLEGLMLKLKLQYFVHLMWRADSLEKSLMLGKIKGQRRRGQQRMMVRQHQWFKGHEFVQNLGFSEVQVVL